MSQMLRRREGDGCINGPQRETATGSRNNKSDRVLGPGRQEGDHLEKSEIAIPAATPGVVDCVCVSLSPFFHRLAVSLVVYWHR